MGMQLSEYVENLIKENKEDVISDIRNDFVFECKRTTKNIHLNIIAEWFGKYNSTSAINAAKNNYLTRSTVNNDRIEIITNFSFDLNAYKEKPKAEAWRARHKDIPSLDGKEWVLGILQLNRGIIGLPDYYNAKGNLVHAIQKTPLRKEIDISPKWNKFGETVINNVLKKRGGF